MLIAEGVTPYCVQELKHHTTAHKYVQVLMCVNQKCQMQNNNYSRSLKGIFFFLVKDLGLITCPEELECLPSFISWTPLSVNLVPNTCSGSPWQGSADEHEPKRWSPSPFPGPQAPQDAFLCCLCSLYHSLSFRTL